MEVHHIPAMFGERKKKWGEYFSEFLMIFLAVTLGFFAGGFRETVTDNKHEKEYMQSMIADLQVDTANIHFSIISNKDKMNSLDSIIRLLALDNLSVLEIQRLHRFGRELLSMYYFSFSTRTLTQLKYSGGLRLIRIRAVSDSIMNYDFVSHLIEEQSSVYRESGIDCIKEAYYVLDFTYILNPQINDRKVPLLYSSYKDHIKILSNKIQMNKGIIQTYLSLIALQQDNAERLIKLLHVDYDLD